MDAAKKLAEGNEHIKKAEKQLDFNISVINIYILNV